MRVKLLTDRGDQKAGTEVEMSDDRARQLIATGGAVEAGPSRTADRGKLDIQTEAGGTVSLRFRRTSTVGGTTHQANTLAAVEASEEAWKLVDTGAADLEPPPGVGGQPFPPEWLHRRPEEPAPTSEAPPSEPRAPGRRK